MERCSRNGSPREADHRAADDETMATETTALMNMQNRYRGFSHSQRVVGRQTRHGGEQGDDETFHALNTLEERVDPTTELAERMIIRLTCKSIQDDE